MTTQDQATYDTADLEPISTASSPEALQQAMDIARTAANAQAELEAQGIDPLSPADDDEEQPETPAADGDGEESTEDEPADEAQESEAASSTDDEEPEEEPAQQEEPPEPTPQPPSQPAYSRRDAARFKSELDSAQTELQTLRSQVRAHQTSDASIIQDIKEQAGSEQEFQQLTQKNNLGQTSDQEKQRLAVMQQWRTVAGPIYRQAQLQMTDAFSRAYTAATKYEGMTEELARNVMQSADPSGALDAIHQAGFAAGVAKATQDGKDEQKKVQAENQRLKAELSSVKSKQVAAKPQPAAPDGTTPGAMPKLPPMFLEDGVTLNPEFEKLASSGRLYGVERLTG